MTFSSHAQGFVCVAAVAGAHGVRGGMKLRCFTTEPENVAAYGPVFDERGCELFALELKGLTRGGVIATARGIVDRDTVEAMRGLRLFVPRKRLPAPEVDEFYLDDLIGLEATTTSGQALGKVAAVYNFGAGDMLEIRGAGRVDLIVPFTREAVPEVDLPGGRVLIDPPHETVVEGTTP